MTLPEKFNEHVECDSIFYKIYIIILHTGDRCTRWHAGKIIADKNEQTSLDAVHEGWIAIWGIMHTDGESGFTSNNAEIHFHCQGIILKTRAPEHYARHVDAGEPCFGSACTSQRSSVRGKELRKVSKCCSPSVYSWVTH